MCACIALVSINKRKEKKESRAEETEKKTRELENVRIIYGTTRARARARSHPAQRRSAREKEGGVFTTVLFSISAKTCRKSTLYRLPTCAFSSYINMKRKMCISILYILYIICMHIMCAAFNNNNNNT